MQIKPGHVTYQEFLVSNTTKTHGNPTISFKDMTLEQRMEITVT